MLPAGIAAAVAILAIARPAPLAPPPMKRRVTIPRVEPPKVQNVLVQEPAPMKVEPVTRGPAALTAAERLGLDSSTAQAFEATREVVRAELIRIQREMGKSFAAFPVDLPDAALQDIQRTLEEHFRPERESALSRLEAFLDERESHRQFREGLESWVMEQGSDP
jgi:hypothetical protein